MLTATPIISNNKIVPTVAAMMIKTMEKRVNSSMYHYQYYKGVRVPGTEVVGAGLIISANVYETFLNEHL